MPPVNKPTRSVPHPTRMRIVPRPGSRYSGQTFFRDTTHHALRLRASAHSSHLQQDKSFTSAIAFNFSFLIVEDHRTKLPQNILPDKKNALNLPVIPTGALPPSGTRSAGASAIAKASTPSRNAADRRCPLFFRCFPTSSLLCALFLTKDSASPPADLSSFPSSARAAPASAPCPLPSAPLCGSPSPSLAYPRRTANYRP
jgi:hypothetical protein